MAYDKLLKYIKDVTGENAELSKGLTLQEQLEDMLKAYPSIEKMKGIYKSPEIAKVIGILEGLAKGKTTKECLNDRNIMYDWKYKTENLLGRNNPFPKVHPRGTLLWMKRAYSKVETLKKDPIMEKSSTAVLETTKNGYKYFVFHLKDERDSHKALESLTTSTKKSFIIEYQGVHRRLSPTNERILADALYPKFNKVIITSTFRNQEEQAQAMLENIKSTAKGKGLMEQFAIYETKADYALLDFIQYKMEQYPNILKEIQKDYATAYAEHMKRDNDGILKHSSKMNYHENYKTYMDQLFSNGDFIDFNRDKPKLAECITENEFYSKHSQNSLDVADINHFFQGNKKILATDVSSFDIAGLKNKLSKMLTENHVMHCEFRDSTNVTPEPHRYITESIEVYK